MHPSDQRPDHKNQVSKQKQCSQFLDKHCCASVDDHRIECGRFKAPASFTTPEECLSKEVATLVTTILVRKEWERLQGRPARRCPYRLDPIPREDSFSNIPFVHPELPLQHSL